MALARLIRSSQYCVRTHITAQWLPCQPGRKLADVANDGREATSSVELTVKLVTDICPKATHNDRIWRSVQLGGCARSLQLAQSWVACKGH